MFPEDFQPPLTTDEPAPFAPDDLEAEGRELPPDDPAFRLFDQFGALCAQKAKLKAELEEVEDRMDRLQAPIRSFFAAHPQLENLRSHGFTIFVRTEIWVRPKAGSSRQAVCDTLRTTGLGHYVHDDFSTNSVSKYVRELEQQNRKELQSGAVPDVSALLPAPLAEVLNISPKVTIQGRKGKQERND